MDRIPNVAIPKGLYERWERQHWQAQAIDFTQDRRDWTELSDKERKQWYWLAGFSHFRESEVQALLSLGALLPCLPRADQRFFLATQIADEGRHAYFFERFHREVLDANRIDERARPAISPTYERLFLTLTADLSRAAAARPEDCAALAVAVVHIFIVLEGSIALATFSTVRRVLERVKLFPGLLEGLTYAQRDEVRHAQFGLAVLMDLVEAYPTARDAAVDHVREILPLFSRVLEPQADRMAVLSSLGLDPFDRRSSAFGHLQRQLQVMGIGSEMLDPWIAAA